MGKEIHLLKNNSNKDLTDLEWVKAFYDHLRYEKEINPTKAFSIIYYLQECFPLLPDHIEQCSQCKDLYDNQVRGYHSELTQKNYCDNCYPYDLAEKEERKEEREFKKSIKKGNKQ